MSTAGEPRVQIVSDLHLEWHQDQGRRLLEELYWDAAADAIVLAGDIGSMGRQRRSAGVRSPRVRTPGERDVTNREPRFWHLLPVCAAAAGLIVGGWVFHQHGRSVWVAWLRPLTGTRSVEGVVRALDGTAGARVREALLRARVPRRPSRLWLLAVKDERRLELWASSAPGERVFVTSWPVLAASGGEGPKLREGDRQVPEGIYRIEGLNPNSAYHLSLRVGYPSSSDRAWAARDGRTQLGGDIFIHGKDVSIGCLAIGDTAIEELFWLAGTVGHQAFRVVIVPTDLLHKPAPKVSVPWAPELYDVLRAELARFGPRDRLERR